MTHSYAKNDLRNYPHVRQSLRINKPQNLREHLYHLGSAMPGYIGRKSSKRLWKAYSNRIEADFYAVVDALPKGSLCIDLGANVGEVTKALLQRGMRVIAFEPDPATFAVLEEAVGQDTRAQLINAAASVQDGTATLARTPEWNADTLAGSQSSSLVFDEATINNDTSVEVLLIDLAAFLRYLGERVALLKMDIEGGEWELFPHLVEQNCLPLLDHMYVETHEWRDPTKRPLANQFRQQAEGLATPVIHFNWV